jgi:hypothetical protein
MNKTKRYKGGYNEHLLDDDFIITNLKDILNQRPLQYKFNIYSETTNLGKFFNVYIENADKEIQNYNIDKYPCLEISFNENTQGVSIKVELIAKCAPIKNYGNFILSCLKEFADKFGYYSVIIISDGSTLDFNFYDDNKQKQVYIDLAQLSILRTGESWYNRFGFYNSYSKEQIENNKLKINQKFSSLDDSLHIIEYIDKKIKQYKKYKKFELPKCFQLINSYGKFREIYNFILEITKKTDDDTIEDVFYEVNNYIKNNCDTNNKTCNVDYLTIQKISCFIEFVYELLELKYRATNLSYISKKYSAGKILRKKKKNTKTNKRKTRKIR